MANTAAPDTPPRHEYTSFSTLLKNSPKGTDSAGSPQNKKKAGGNDATGSGNAGWNLSSVSEEPGTIQRGGKSRNGGNRGEGGAHAPGSGKEKKTKEHMGLWKMMALTISMAGSQVRIFFESCRF